MRVLDLRKIGFIFPLVIVCSMLSNCSYEPNNEDSSISGSPTDRFKVDFKAREVSRNANFDDGCAGKLVRGYVKIPTQFISGYGDTIAAAKFALGNACAADVRYNCGPLDLNRYIANCRSEANKAIGYENPNYTPRKVPMSCSATSTDTEVRVERGFVGVDTCQSLCKKAMTRVVTRVNEFIKNKWPLTWPQRYSATCDSIAILNGQWRNSSSVRNPL